MPSALGHQAPSGDSSCCLIDAHAVIWPLYLAGNCALERVREEEASIEPGLQCLFDAAAQSAWILGRLDYVSKFAA